MKPLFDMSDRNKIIAKKQYPFECYQCHSIFHVEGRFVRYNLKTDSFKKPYKYCSAQCVAIDKTISSNEQCKNCNNSVVVEQNVKKKSKTGNYFCTQSCAATYNNKHKTTGTRRSKLEKWLEIELTILFPELNIQYNKKSTIESELDIYVSKLKLAIELNGPVHYKPIYGKEKFNQIQKNDLLKKEACIKNDITLIIIDVSKYSPFNPITARPFLDAICLMIKAKTTFLFN